jgi:hypothetical protein
MTFCSVCVVPFSIIFSNTIARAVYKRETSWRAKIILFIVKNCYKPFGWLVAVEYVHNMATYYIRLNPCG